VHPSVRVWAESVAAGQSRFLRLYVQDNGIGIPVEAHGKIFEIFLRLSTKYDGTGIGLAIVKKAVERMGGKVGVQSAPGNGSTFWLDLPAAA
jgi:signal transduction histidine kinase